MMAGYQEKFYFSPGDTGFKVFKTRKGCVGVGICWDQVFKSRSYKVCQAPELTGCFSWLR
jgi:predicted amidohydrolase